MRAVMMKNDNPNSRITTIAPAPSSKKFPQGFEPPPDPDSKLRRTWGQRLVNILSSIARAAYWNLKPVPPLIDRFRDHAHGEIKNWLVSQNNNDLR